MSEPPDFDRIALDLCLAGDRDGPGSTEIAEQLRLVWNARGAADLVKVEAELSTLMGATASGPYTKNLDRALRSLDR